MPRLKNLIVAAVNITTELPHTPERYLKLFRKMREMVPAPVGEIGRNERMMINFFAEDALSLTGSFARFTHIAKDAAWWDTKSRAAILDEKGRPVPQVPDGIGPNLRAINFYFLINEHILVFDTREIGPKQFARGLSQMFNSKEIIEAFGVINVTVEPRVDALSQLLALPNKRSVRIVISLPNGPDVPDTMEGKVKRRYEAMRLAKTEQKYIGHSGEDFVPDEELVASINLAGSNGYAEVEYVGGSGVIESQSTKDYPLKEKYKCYENEYWSTIKWLTGKIVEIVRGRNDQGQRPPQ